VSRENLLNHRQTSHLLPDYGEIWYVGGTGGMQWQCSANCHLFRFNFQVTITQPARNAIKMLL